MRKAFLIPIVGQQIPAHFHARDDRPGQLPGLRYPSAPRHCRSDSKSTLCGHLKHRIHDTWNQTVATLLELGFLGGLRGDVLQCVRSIRTGLLARHYCRAGNWLGISLDHDFPGFPYSGLHQSEVARRFQLRDVDHIPRHVVVIHCPR